MSTGIWIISIVTGLVLLSLGFRLAVKRGGQKVKPINPQNLIIYPDENDNAVAQGRLIPLDGAYNFRDLGGYRTREGRRVCWGQFFRSDELSELSDADLVALQTRNVRAIIDLRSPRELKGKENRLPAGSTYQQIQIYKREPIAGYLGVALFRRHLLAQALGASYIKLAETRAKAFGAALRLLAQPENLPIVYHCSAGKDRTGILCALALSVLGVPEETIIADYSLSNLGFDHYYTEFVSEGHLAGWGVPYEEFQTVFIVQPDWMRNLLAHLKEKYGGVENYLLQKAGLELQELENIRENLLE